MKVHLLLAAFLALLSGQCFTAQPNIIYMLADDLGYGDLGSYGQKLVTQARVESAEFPLAAKKKEQR